MKDGKKSALAYFFLGLMRMIKQKRKKILVVCLVVAALIVVPSILISRIGKPSRAELAAITEENMDELFNKTIHDFPGHLIDNLDEQEDTNFIVYAKGVKKLSTGDGMNMVASADNEKREYVVLYPSKELEKLKKGDVFFIEGTDYYPLGIVVKVKSIASDGYQATIKGSEFQLEELIAYADVDMDVSLDKVYVEENGHDYNIWLDEYRDNEQELWDGQNDDEMFLLETASHLINEEGQLTETALAVMQPEEYPVVSLADNNEVTNRWYRVLENNLVDTTIFQSVNLSTSLEGIIGPLNAKGSLGVKLSDFHIVFKVYPLFLTMHAEITANARAYVDGRLGFKGTISSDPYLYQKLPKIFVPLGGPIFGTFASYFSVDVGGSIYGRYSAAADTTIGFCDKIIAGVHVPQVICTQPDNFAGKINMVEAEGELQINLLNVYSSVGIPYVFEVYQRARGGIDLEARLEFPEGTVLMGNAEQVHTCKACVDGDIGFQIEAAVGMTAPQMLKAFLPRSISSVGWEKTLLEIDIPVPVKPFDSFYVSMDPGKEHVADGEKLTCDFGECPFKGFEVIIDVTSPIESDRVKASNVVVKLENEESVIQWKLTDEDGEASFIVPAGMYDLYVDHGYFHHTEQIEVGNEASTRHEVELYIPSDVYVVLCAEPEYAATAPVEQIMGGVPYTLIQVDRQKGDGDIMQLIEAQNPNLQDTIGDIVVYIQWDQARSEIEKYKYGEFSQFRLGYANVYVGRILYTYGGVSENGEETGGNSWVNWWLVSYHNFMQNGQTLNYGSYHTDSSMSAPDYEDVYKRSSTTIRISEQPYDIGYVKINEHENHFTEPLQSLGNFTYWDLLAQSSTLGSQVRSIAQSCSFFVQSAYQNQDFMMKGLEQITQHYGGSGGE